MSERTILLTDNTTVTVNTTLSVNRMKMFRNKELISKEMLQNMLTGSEKDVDIMSKIDEASDAVYVAYVNGNMDDHLSKEEFFDLLPYDIKENITIYGEVLGGPTVGKKFAEGFEQATNKRKIKSGKKLEKDQK